MAENETGPEPKSPQDARLDALEARLERVQREETQRTGKAAKPDASEHMGQRVLSYLLGGLLGGSLLGWLADGWFGTGHALLITGMILGIVGSFWSIWKISSR
jgi:ATP synthase protein I